MKVHTIFVEPANYTQDLITQVYHKQGIGYSFLHSNSVATNETKITASAAHLFDQNGLLKNISFLWRCSKQNDLIICNGYNHMAFLVLWLFSGLNKCYIGIESDTPYYTSSGLKGLIKAIYLKLIFAHQKILGLPGGTNSHRELFLNYGMNKERIFFMPMMVDNEKYKQALKEERLLQTPINFIFVGRLVEEKNPALLVKAFKNVLQTGSIANLTIVGEGNCSAELAKLSSGNPNIRLLGKKFGAALLSEYQKADVLVLPSSFEPWGLVVNEAMAAGLPVLCSSAVGAAHDLVAQPNTGWVFKVNSEEELTNQLMEIINHPLQIKEKAKRGQDFMLNYWNYGLYIKCLNQILAYAKKD
jgi:glycosyltransferase involved in cell wall biosynthesis